MPDLIIRLSGIKCLYFHILRLKKKYQHWFGDKMNSVFSIENYRIQWEEQYPGYAVGKS